MNVPSKSLTLIGLFLAAGCANYASAPPAPHVTGLDSYVAGAQAYNTGDDQKAQELLEQAVDANPDLIMAHQLLGDVYRKQRDYRHAVEQYQEFIRLDPYNFKGHYDAAIAYQFLNRFQEAAAAYVQALLLSPRDLNSNMNLGLVYLALGRTDDAIRQLQLAVTIDPTSAAAYCNLGVALDAGNQYTKAETAYRRAVELDPTLTIAVMDLGSNLIRQQRGQEAAAVMTAAIQKNPTPLAHKLLADSLVLQHRDDDALAEYRAALDLNANYYPALNEIGMIFLRKYQAGMTLDESLRQSALATWRKSLALHADQPQIKQLIARWDQSGKLTP